MGSVTVKQNVLPHRYRVEHDPAGWLKVDPNKGDITTVKIPDRESPHVVNGVYTALLHAVDNGKTLTSYLHLKGYFSIFEVVEGCQGFKV